MKLKEIIDFIEEDYVIVVYKDKDYCEITEELLEKNINILEPDSYANLFIYVVD